MSRPKPHRRTCNFGRTRRHFSRYTSIRVIRDIGVYLATTKGDVGVREGERLKKMLNQNHFCACISPPNDRRLYYKTGVSALESTLDQISVVVAVIDGATDQSSYLLDQLKFADENGVPVLAYCLQGADVDDNIRQYLSANLTVCADDDIVSADTQLIQLLKETLGIRIEGDFMLKDRTLVQYIGTEEEVTVPEGIERIGDKAFSLYGNIKHIHLPDTLEDIGDSAFASCYSLTDLVIPSRVSYIGESAFESCCSITSVTVPDGVSIIRDSLFSECRDLTSVSLPSRIEEIGDSAFCNCTELKHINIPDGVKIIKNRAFYGCESLKEIILPDGVSDLFYGVFYSCTELERIMLPKGLSYIGEYAFYNCKSLTHLDLPEGLLIVEEAFLHCSGLKTVRWPSTAERICAKTFAYCSSLAEFTVPEGVVRIDDSAFLDCLSLKRVSLPSTLRTVESRFSKDGECTMNTAFLGCKGLKEINVANGNPHYYSVDGVLFNKPKDVLIVYPSGRDEEEYRIPSGTKKIGASAFGARALKHLIIPESVHRIAAEALEGNNLSAITVEQDNRHYCSEDGVLFSRGKRRLLLYPPARTDSSYRIPKGVKAVCARAFYNNSFLTRLYIPAGLTKIKPGGICFCDALLHLVFEEGVKLFGIDGYKELPYFNAYLTGTLSGCHKESMQALYKEVADDKECVMTTTAESHGAAVASRVIQALAAVESDGKARREDVDFYMQCALEAKNAELCAFLMSYRHQSYPTDNTDLAI